MEPDRCIGFEKMQMEDFDSSEISLSTYTFMQHMLKNK